MRTTIDLNKDLVEKAMAVTGAKTRTEAIRLALENIIAQEKMNRLIRFHGKVDLNIDLDTVRDR